MVGDSGTGHASLFPKLTSCPTEESLRLADLPFQSRPPARVLSPLLSPVFPFYHLQPISSPQILREIGNLLLLLPTSHSNSSWFQLSQPKGQSIFLFKQRRPTQQSPSLATHTHTHTHTLAGRSFKTPREERKGCDIIFQSPWGEHDSSHGSLRGLEGPKELWIVGVGGGVGVGLPWVALDPLFYETPGPCKRRS